MQTPRISASSYSNTAPLIWSFLYGSHHGRVELTLDNAPARSADLLASGTVDAALVPVIAYQSIKNARLVPNVCIGTRERARSVCLVTSGRDLKDVRSVSLDASSRTSVVLTKILFREFLGFEPRWLGAEPDFNSMLAQSDAALLIGDPALSITTYPGGTATVKKRAQADRTATVMERASADEPATVRKRASDHTVGTATVVERASSAGEANTHVSAGLRTYDLAELWKHHTNLGFVFAMWMARKDNCGVDFVAARDEGLAHIDRIISNYGTEIGLSRDEMRQYLTQDISYSVDDSMQAGMELYFKLARKHSLIGENKPLRYTTRSSEQPRL